MGVRLILFILGSTSIIPTVLVSDDTPQKILPCRTYQYIELGKNGTIICNAKTGVNQIHWYNSKDSLHNYPVISLSHGSISGSGYLSGEYHIQPDGSLVFNVAVLEDQIFKVVMLSDDDILCEQIVHVLVFEKPEQIHPFIDKCGSQRYCHQNVYSDLPLQLTCSVYGAKPEVNISWELWTTEGFQKLHNDSLWRDGNTSNLTVDFKSIELEVFVCKVKSPAFEMNSSMILIEWSSSENKGGVIGPLLKTVPLASKVKLDCGRSTITALIWKKCTSVNKDDCVVILHTTFEQKVILLNEYDVTNTGELLIDKVKVHDGSWFWCLSSDGTEISEKIYQLNIYALPNPPYLIVEECDGYKSCNINSGWEGNLSCSIFGVRPKANLEWAVLPMLSSTAISFHDQKINDVAHDDVYDITLKTLYVVEDIVETQVEVECRATLNIDEMPSLFTRVGLLLPDTGTRPAKNPMTSILTKLLPSLCVLSVFVILAFSFKGRCCRGKGGHGSKKNSEDEENTLITFPRQTETQEMSEEELTISLTTFKMELALLLGIEETLRLIPHLEACLEEPSSIEASKNPPLTLMNMLCRGSANSVMQKLALLEVVARKLEMNEIKRVVDGFIRNHFRSTFMLKVNIATDHKSMDGNETQNLWKKLLMDYSRSANIADLQSFFKNEYDATTSSITEGSLFIQLKLSSAKKLSKLRRDIRSGELRLRISPFLVNLNVLKKNCDRPFELNITYNEKAYRTLITNLQEVESSLGSETSTNKENNQTKIHKNITTEIPQTVLMREIISLKLQIAEYIGRNEASHLCQQLGLVEKLKEDILSSKNPGLEVINFLFRNDGMSLHEILNVIIEATYQLKWLEVNYILHKFKLNFKHRDTNITTESTFWKFAKFCVKTSQPLVLLSIGVTEAIIQEVQKIVSLVRGAMETFCPQVMINIWELTIDKVTAVYSHLIEWITAKVIPVLEEDRGSPRTSEDTELSTASEKQLDEDEGQDQATLRDEPHGSDSHPRIKEGKKHEIDDQALQGITEDLFLQDSRWKDLLEQCNKIVEMAWINEGEPPFMDFELSLLNMASSQIRTLRTDLEVSIYDGSAIGTIGGFLTTVGVGLGPFTFGTSLTIAVAGMTLSSVGSYLSTIPRIIHIHGSRCMRLNLSPVILKLMRIVRALDNSTIILAKIHSTMEQLIQLSVYNMNKKISRKELDALFESSSQPLDPEKPFVLRIEHFCKTLEKLYIILERLYKISSENLNGSAFERRIRKLNLDDAILSVVDHTQDATRPLRQFLLMYYGIIEEHNQELKWPDGGMLSGQDREIQKLKIVREKLSIQALKTSEIAKKFTENDLTELEKSASEISPIGVILSTPGTFIDFGKITKKMIDFCKGSDIEIKFVFEQLQHQVAVINRIATKKGSKTLRTMYSPRIYFSDCAFSLLT